MDTRLLILMVYNMRCLQGCVVPIHVSMEASAQRLETGYVSVHWASKGRDANTVSFHPHLIKKVSHVYKPTCILHSLHCISYAVYRNKLSAAL